jgi:small subunit ribosomal protein S21
VINIKVRDGEPFEKAFKRFTKSCEKAGLIASIKKYQFYEKPSEKEKRKSNQSKRKMLKMVSDIEKMKRRKVTKF